MPKREEIESTTKEKKHVKKIDNDLDKFAIRIGAYYSKFNTHQRKRFKHIVASFGNKLGIDRRKSPIEVTLIRLIAANLIRVEYALAKVIDTEDPDYASNMEKWLLQNQKEIRDGIQLLSTLTKVTAKKDGVSVFDQLRDEMRVSEGLPPSKEKGILKDGHDRRYHDDKVDRSVK